MPAVSANVSRRMRDETRHLAEARGQTMADVLRRALTEHLAEAHEQADDIRRIQEIEARHAAGLSQSRPMEDVWAELDALEARGALPD